MLPLINDGRDVLRHPSVVRNHDFPKMAAVLKMAVGLLCVGESECPIDHRVQAILCDSPVHRLEIGAAPNAERAERNVAAG